LSAFVGGGRKTAWFSATEMQLLQKLQAKKWQEA
jgi:hypothetical protein